jgi:hypothetical protein
MYLCPIVLIAVGQVQDHQVGHAIEWEFVVESRDVVFRVDYVPAAPASSSAAGSASDSGDLAADADDEAVAAAAADSAEPGRQPVLPPTRHAGKVTGTHRPQAPGTYYLHWDNTYSMLTRKTVRYEIRLVPPPS